MSLLSLEHVRRGRILTTSTERLAVTATILGSTGVAILALLAASPGIPRWPAVPLLALALATAAAPDSLFGLTGLAAFSAWWLVAVPETTSVWSLVAALALLVGHAATAYASAGPATLHAEPAVRRAWTRDICLVAGATAALWSLARLVTGAPDPGQSALGVTLLLVGLGIAAVNAQAPARKSTH
jgi:hypothetical protein